jgi:hypothetical protein
MKKKNVKQNPTGRLMQSVGFRCECAPRHDNLKNIRNDVAEINDWQSNVL